MTRKVIDGHVHIFRRGSLPRKWYEIGAKRWAASKWPPADPKDIDIEGGLIDDDDLSLLIPTMDAAGVDSVVCLSLDWGVRYGEPEISLRDTHAWYGDLQRRFPGRVYATAACDPRREDAQDILDAALGADELHGVKIYPPTGFHAFEDKCNPIYEKCLEYDVPLVVHTAFVGFPHLGHYANPLYMNDVQAKYPDLRIVLAHSGFPFWNDEAIEVASHHHSTYLEISNWNVLLNSDPGEVRKRLVNMIRHVGAHRVIFASDHLGGYRSSGARSRMRVWRDFVEALGEPGPDGADPVLTVAELDLILYQNAERVFRLA